MKKKATKKAKRTRWVVMCLGDGESIAAGTAPWRSANIPGSGIFTFKKAAQAAADKYGSKRLIYTVVPYKK